MGFIIHSGELDFGKLFGYNIMYLQKAKALGQHSYF